LLWREVSIKPRRFGIVKLENAKIRSKDTSKRLFALVSILTVRSPPPVRWTTLQRYGMLRKVPAYSL
jgi:hypothetical protein